MLPPPAPPVFDTRQTPEIVFDLRALSAMQAGVNQLVNALRPTLGPFPHVVAVERAIRGKSPELLDSGGEIARRIIDLPDKTENVGAMLARGMIWKLHERIGDGTVTAAVIFQSLFNQGVRYLAAGGSPAPLRAAFEKGSALVIEELRAMATPVRGQKQLADVARSLVMDDALAEMLGECFHIIGAEGEIEIRSSQRRETVCEYLQGSHWSGGWFGGETRRVEVEDAGILITDLALEEAHHLVQVLRAASQAQIRTLFVVCASISDKALALSAQSQRTETLRLFPVRVNEVRRGMVETALDDLALLTGGRVVRGAAGESWEGIRADHFGQARRLWADKHYVGAAGGHGDPGAVRRLIDRLHQVAQSASETAVREAALERIGKLYSGSAVIDIGGSTEAEAAFRRGLAKRAVNTLRTAQQTGVVPGGGAALFHLGARLREAALLATCDEERARVRMLQAALQVPMRVLLDNAGIDHGILGEVERGGTGFGVDVRSGAVVPMAQAGLLDVAGVLALALRQAAHHAALALTVNAVVHRRKPPISAHPDGMEI